MSSGKHFKPNKEELYDLYITQGKTAASMADIYGVDPKTMAKHLRLLGIKKNKWDKEPIHLVDAKTVDKQKFLNLINQKHTLQQIRGLLGITPQVLDVLFEMHDIDRQKYIRSRSKKTQLNKLTSKPKNFKPCPHAEKCRYRSRENMNTCDYLNKTGRPRNKFDHDTGETIRIEPKDCTLWKDTHELPNRNGLDVRSISGLIEQDELNKKVFRGHKI